MKKLQKNITEIIDNFLAKYKLLSQEKVLLVGFSGGVDSMCMLDNLSKLQTKHGFKLAAAHLNHNWRGEESKKEAQKAESFCKERGIEFCTETLSADLPQTEEEARKQRYMFFNRVAKKINATAILTGHTRTDQAETVLYRIIKGTGTTGLKGIPEFREQKEGPTIFRPIIELAREDCIQYCEENNLSFSVDPSNYDEKYFRNRIRHSLLPELRTYNNAIDDSIIRLADIASESEEIIEEYLNKLRKEIYIDSAVKTQLFIKQSESVKKRMLVDFLHNNDIEYTYENIKDLYEFIEENVNSKSGKTFSIAKGLWVFVSGKEIKLINNIKAKKTELVVPVNIKGETLHSELNISLEITEWKGEKPDRFPKESEDVALVDLSEIKLPLYLRTRGDGDVIQPFGMKEKTKLKKYLINRGVPGYLRDEIPVLTNDKEVLWVAGVGISELLRAKDIPTHTIKINKKNTQHN